MASTIKLKQSSTPASVPTTGDITIGELAINVADQILYSSNGTGVFQVGTGTVTSVGITAGNLIDVTGSPVTGSGSITVDVDLSELTTSTADADGDFFVVVDSVNAQKKLTKANIALSGFNNDAGFHKITVSNTAPSTPSVDDLWVDIT